LRKAVLAEAVAAGVTHDRAGDVVLAVHELAANAVCHGGGAGRVHLRAANGALHCVVSDDGPGSTDGHARAGTAVAVQPWLFKPGHGLWLVRNLADDLAVASSWAGSQVTAVFTLPGEGGGTGG
jgi:anti-sigma regulatory factor (Ser/Thr protein kinase)